MSKSPLFAGKTIAKKKSTTPSLKGKWKILIVDDDQEVHSVTKLVLSKVQFKGKGLELLSAFSAEEAKEVIAKTDDLAIILLDVVMETDDAGLNLVKYIRNDLNNLSVRIILRTGQPGQAPEEQVIIDYDINDYKAKTELTSQKLFTACIAAIRSYETIIALEHNRSGLEQILESTDSLFTHQSMRLFASGVLTQIGSFIGGGPDGIVCVEKRLDCNQSGNLLCFLAGSGQYSSLGKGCEKGTGNTCLDKTNIPVEVQDAIDMAMSEQKSVFSDSFSAIYVPVRDGDETVVFVNSDHSASEVDRKLLEVFISKISMGFSNVTLWEELEERVEARTVELQEANHKLAHLALHDPLTDLFNRRHFMDEGIKETKALQRHGRPLALMMLDIDHFKVVNDTYGHGVGDEALKATARSLEVTLRPSDILGRIGGEEFAILLPETSLEDATMLAERIREEMADLKINAGAEVIKITVSIGVTLCKPGGPETFDVSLAEADKALYEAKETGRNRVVTNRG
ncbi:MAG: diguanylate cyclase [Alphaproteobacteria bacterium]|nr:diguanylate cyclase [Alphaproteobacteria bacterium]